MKQITLTEKRFFEWHEDNVSVTLRNKSASYGGGQRGTYCCKEIGSLCADDYKGINSQYVNDGKVIVQMKHYGIDNHPADSRVTLSQDGIMQTLSSRMGTGGGNTPMILTDKENDMEDELIVRRLTPLECERLQGFPDNWTLIGEPRQKLVKDYKTFWKLGTSESGEPSIEVTKKEQIGSHYETVYVWKDSKGKEHECTDSARYMALGNSLALPQWWWLVNRLKRVLPEGATLASLFDGIGGFPLVWEETFGKGTAIWASEIEEFPIAVTREHFKEDEHGG